MTMRVSLLLPLALLCACGNDNTNTRPPDMTMGDFAPIPDMAPLLSGTQLAPGDVQLAGVTDDDKIIYFDMIAGLRAIPVAGGTPTLIDADAENVSTQGNVVFSWSAVGGTTEVGTLTVWTAAGGPKVVAMASKVYHAAASADGAWILYIDNADTNGDIADIKLARVDGTGAVTVAPMVAVTQANCIPQLAFAGGRGVFTWCPAPGDMGMKLPTVSSVDPASGMVTTLLTDAANAFDTDDAGAKVLVQSSAGALQVVPIGGGTPTMIDQDVFSSTFLGSDVLYTTKARVLKRTPAAMPMPVTVANEVARIDFVSPDARTILSHDAFDFMSGLTDLSIVATAPPSQGTLAKATVLVGEVSAGVYYDPFTVDSSLAVFYSLINDNGSGTLEVVKTSDPMGMASRWVIAEDSWIERVGKGTTVVFNDHYMPTTSSGYADIRYVDASKAGNAPVLVANRADPEFMLSHNRDRVVYTFSAVTGRKGLYVAPIP